MISTIEDLKTRRSVRKFKDKQIDPDILEEILEVGTYAPSGMGKQASKIVVVQDKELIKRFAQWNKLFFPEELAGKIDDPFFGAPTLIIVLADSEVRTHVEDGSLVIGNILNAAHALDIGGCWIHRAREEFESLQGKELLKVWDIPDKYVGIGHVVLGYPADDFEAKIVPRKDDYIIYADDSLKL